MSTEPTRFLAPARPALAATLSTPEVPMRILLDVVVRLLAVLAVDLVFVKVVDIPGDDGLGTGLLAFATLVLVSGAVGLYDGFRRSFAHLAVVWVLVGLLYGVASTVLGAALFPPVDWDVVASDLATVAPFTAGLVAVPALLAGGLMSVVRAGTERPGAGT